MKNVLLVNMFDMVFLSFAPIALERSEEKPIPKNNEVLIKIKATAVTASDCIIRGFKMTGKLRFPKKQITELVMGLVVGFTKPRNPIIGLVLSGDIESVGKDRKLRKGTKHMDLPDIALVHMLSTNACLKKTRREGAWQ